MKIKNIKSIFMGKVLILTVFCFQLVNGQNIRINSSTEKNLVIGVDIDNIHLKKAKCIDGKEYDFIPASNKREMSVGKPDIPAFASKILIPIGAEFDISVIKGKPVIHKNISIAPVQEPLADIKDSKTPDFVIDKNVYSADKFFPEIFAEVESINIRREQQSGFLVVYPYQYNPVSKELAIYPDLEVKVNFSGSKNSVPSRLRSANHDAFFKSTTINGSEILKNQIKSVDNSSKVGCELLIITHNTFEDAADMLADWKNSIGISTMVVATNDINSNYNSLNNDNRRSTIENYIDNTVYATWNPVPDYILFLGDAEFIPPWYVTNHPYGSSQGRTGTDYYYVDIHDNANDFSPEFFSGRIPVDNLTEAENFVHRIIRHERNPQSTDFFNSASCIAYFQTSSSGYAQRRFTKTAEDVREYLVDQNYDVDRIYVTGSSSYNPSNWSTSSNYVFENDVSGAAIPSELLRSNGFAWDGDAADIDNAIEDGRFFALHRDHGARTYWGDPYFNQTHINNINNGELRSTVWSINCQTGWFDNETDDASCNTSTTSESFTETWITHATGGAVSLIAATRVSYSGYNDRLVWGFMDAIYPDFIEFHNGSYGNSTSIQRIGEVVDYGKNYMETKKSAGTVRKTEVEEFHCFGDPTMEFIPERCRTNLSVIDDQINGSQSMNFRASNQITVSETSKPFIVENNGNGDFAAGSSVKFKKGFHAKAGSAMHAYLANCSGRECLAKADGDEPTEKAIAENTNRETTAVETVPLDPSFNIYPNPNNGTFNIHRQGVQEQIERIEVINYTGQVVYTQMNVSEMNHKIDISRQPNGVYFVRLKTSNSIITQKIIKK